jgi:hypothetical protein
MATFHQMPDRVGLGVSPEQIVAVIESINAPNISVPNAGTSPTKAYIVGIRLPSGNFTVCLYMHLLDLDTAAIFAPDPQEVTLEGYPTLEADAIQFVESMGFMLDNLNFRGRSAEEQQKMQQTLPIFFDRPPPRANAGATNFHRPATGGFQRPATGQMQMPQTGFGQQPVTGGTQPPMGGGGGNLSPEETQALARLLSAF